MPEKPSRNLRCRLGFHAFKGWSRDYGSSNLIGEPVAHRHCRKCGKREEIGFEADIEINVLTLTACHAPNSKEN